MRHGVNFLGRHAPAGGKYGANFYGGGHGATFVGGAFRANKPYQMSTYPMLPQFRTMNTVPPEQIDKWFADGHNMQGGNFLDFLGKASKTATRLFSPLENIKRLPGFLERLAASPKDAIKEWTHGNGLHGGFLQALIPFIAPIAAGLKSLLGAAAIGAAGSAGGYGAAKLFGKGNSGYKNKKDSAFLSLGGYNAKHPHNSHDMIRKLKAINHASRISSNWDTLNSTQGGALGDIFGKIFGGLKNIAKNHGLNTAKGLLSGAKGGVKNIDFSELLKTRGKDFGAYIKKGALKLKDPLSNAATQFGERLLKDGSQFAANKLIKAAEDKINKHDPKYQKKLKKELKKKEAAALAAEEKKLAKQLAALKAKKRPVKKAIRRIADVYADSDDDGGDDVAAEIEEESDDEPPPRKRKRKLDLSNFAGSGQAKKICNML